MSFRMKLPGGSRLGAASILLEQSFSLRYVMSLTLFLDDPKSFLLLLQALYIIYPYSIPGAEEYRKYYDENKPTADNLSTWTEGLFSQIFHAKPTIFSILPDPHEWGPIYWKFLLSLDGASDSVLEKFFTDILPLIIPCNKCRIHLISYLEIHPASAPFKVWLDNLKLSIAVENSPPSQKAMLYHIPLADNKKHFNSSTLSVALPKDYIPQKRKCTGCGNKG